MSERKSIETRTRTTTEEIITITTSSKCNIWSRSGHGVVSACKCKGLGGLSKGGVSVDADGTGWGVCPNTCGGREGGAGGDRNALVGGLNAEGHG